MNASTPSCPIGDGRSLVSADGYQYYNQAFNRGKRSLALDIRRPESRAILEKLVQVIPTPSHILGSNEPQARTQGQETAGTGVQTVGNTRSAVGLTPAGGVRNA